MTQQINWNRLKKKENPPKNIGLQSGIIFSPQILGDLTQKRIFLKWQEWMGTNKCGLVNLVMYNVSPPATSTQKATPPNISCYSWEPLLMFVGSIFTSRSSANTLSRLSHISIPTIPTLSPFPVDTLSPFMQSNMLHEPGNSPSAEQCTPTHPSCQTYISWVG